MIFSLMIVMDCLQYRTYKCEIKDLWEAADYGSC